jgi:ABC-type transporter Mla subunit MlaD
MAGVDIGSVASVRVRPDVRDTPAEVIMALQTPYALRVPKDASVSVETEGVLGPTFADIDIIGASGPPLEDGGVLKSKERPGLTNEELLEHLAGIFKQRPCDQVRSETGIGKTPRNEDSRPR